MDRTHSIRFANTNKKQIESGVLKPIRFYLLCLGGVEDTYRASNRGYDDWCRFLALGILGEDFDKLSKKVCPPMVIPE